MKYTDLQNKVISTAHSQLETKDWFKGICVDLFKRGSELDCDVKIQKLGMKKAVEMVVDDTMYWEGFFC